MVLYADVSGDLVDRGQVRWVVQLVISQHLLVERIHSTLRQTRYIRISYGFPFLFDVATALSV